MGKLIAVEGLDGAGKKTLVAALEKVLVAKGCAVSCRAFPRYGEDVHADLGADALYGRLGDLTDSVYGTALLFALDRRSAGQLIRDDLATADIVLLDRYVASNAAYGAARLHQGADGEFVSWVSGLEIDRFGLPVPDLQVLLRVPVDVAAHRAAQRGRADAGRTLDTFESDNDLQARCGEVYEALAARAWLSPWDVVDGVGEAQAAAELVAAEVVA